MSIGFSKIEQLSLFFTDCQGKICQQRAAMNVCVLCFLLLVACLYPSVAQGSYEDCCLKYGKQRLTKMKPTGYRVQKTDGGCNIPAVIFILHSKNRRFCANPKETWVQKMMEKLKDLTIYQ